MVTKAETKSSNLRNNNNGAGKLQAVLMIFMVVCMGITVYINITSTSSAAMATHHYSAAVSQAIEDFKYGALTMGRQEKIGGSTPSGAGLPLSASTSTTAQQQQQQEMQQQQQQMAQQIQQQQMQQQRMQQQEQQMQQQQMQMQQQQVQQQKQQPKSKIATLSCEPHGGPPDEFAQEMIYWQDISSDSLYVSPLKQKKGEQRRYMTFEPDGGGWNNIRMAMETVVGLAAVMGRTLVLPPQKQMYLLGKGENKQKKHFGFEDFFPMEQMARENAAIEMITMQEFLETEALTGKLRNKETGKVSYPPNNRTNWNGLSGDEYDDLREWLRSVALVPQWNPDKCLAAFPANGDHSSLEELRKMQESIHKEGGVSPAQYIGHPVPVDGPPIDRMKENLNNRKELCVYNETMEKEMVVHFACSHKLGLRLLVHFYAFLYMEDWKEDLWLKRFMRDHMRYNDDIQCAAARLVHAMRDIARKNNPKGNPYGLFDTFHIRRGDFQYKNTRIDAVDIVANSKDYLTPNATIFIATDERDKAFFDPLRKHYNIYFMDDFMDLLKGVNTNYFGMIDQLVASRGRVFFGCWFSTFTGFINRMRGYRSTKDKLPGYEQGILPTSYYYVPNEDNYKLALHQYVALQGSFFSREFPTSWRDIDKGIGELPTAAS